VLPFVQREVKKKFLLYTQEEIEEKKKKSLKNKINQEKKVVKFFRLEKLREKKIFITWRIHPIVMSNEGTRYNIP
jgi:hypothetical protein